MMNLISNFQLFSRRYHGWALQVVKPSYRFFRFSKRAASNAEDAINKRQKLHNHIMQTTMIHDHIVIERRNARGTIPSRAALW